MLAERPHISVLAQEVLDLLAPRAGSRYIDATLGAGGHAAEILNASAPNGRLLGLDADPQAIPIAAERLKEFGDRVSLQQTNFENLMSVAKTAGFIPAEGILFDLGLSSMQLNDAARGFSFLGEGALDMRFDPRGETNAADLVNELPEAELADLIYEYGEERASRRIARAIVYSRPISTAAQLAAVIERAMRRRGRLHPATRTFQALRIAVNRELETLPAALKQAVEILAPQGRVVVITFHSLEDRIVKNFFRNENVLRVLAKHPLRAARAEMLANPRSRSAKLRAAEKVNDVA
ncbi:MAG: 16S rRNA (cytosine(1402)-N(4))-methyltransferase RsmH [Chloroflexi bacterium]|nr:16S rRNA (cytosine(1402)-N(4))-methyltransferase RsmH [Chloroflexota bacterium]